MQRKSIQRTIVAFAAAAAASWAATAGTGGVTLDAARVGAEDVAGLAKFYESAFGLQEVNRLAMPGHLEIMLNFGDSMEAAKANTAAQIVIMHRDSNAIQDPVPHLILNVTDVAATGAAVTAAGGKAEKPIPFGKSGMLIGFAVDPAGNRIELIQRPKG